MNAQYVKAVGERYCPVVGHNVAVEVSYFNGDENISNCLNAYLCDKERGGCTNPFINTDFPHE